MSDDKSSQKRLFFPNQIYQKLESVYIHDIISVKGIETTKEEFYRHSYASFQKHHFETEE